MEGFATSFPPALMSNRSLKFVSADHADFIRHRKCCLSGLPEQKGKPLENFYYIALRTMLNLQR